MEPIESVSILSVSGVQLAPVSTVFHTPPSAAPTYAMPGCVGCTAMHSTRPPTLLGPTRVHFAFDADCIVFGLALTALSEFLLFMFERIELACRRALRTASCGM